MGAFGLALDIVGVALIYKFAVAPRLSPTGATYLVLSGSDHVDQEEKEQYWRYSGLGTLGFVLVSVGFLLQIFSNLMQGSFGCIPPFCS